jgi:hypothetical protein
MANSEDALPRPALPRRQFMTVDLSGGGSVTVSGSFTLFALDGDERRLVSSLIDCFDEFVDAKRSTAIQRANAETPQSIVEIQKSTNNKTTPNESPLDHL